MEFQNVAIYFRREMFGILRRDCREVRITPNQKYAQYTNGMPRAILDGKRTSRTS